MSKLTSLEKIELINQLIKHKREIDIFHKKFDELFGVQNGFAGSSDGHYKVFDRLFNDYIGMVAKQIGECQQGIEWFVWDNDCGKNGMEVGEEGGEMKPIKTASDYIDFIEADY